MKTSRRDFLRHSSLLAAGSLVGGGIPRAAASDPGTSQVRKPVLRFAHITDVHLRPEYEAPRRFRELLRHILKTYPDIDVFLNGGDSIYAADYGNIKRERVDEQWALWTAVVAEELKGVTLHSCLGNHDMWWAVDKDDPMYGKPWVVKQLGIPERHYSFSRAGWHFCILDSNNGGGSLDKPQFDWLVAELEGNKDKHVLLMSHYPIAAYCTVVDGGGLHKDSKALTALFAKHPNVKVAISGHIHLLDHLWYNGVKYHCNGAASGFWWEPGDDGKSSYKQTPPGYAVVELYADGDSRCEYTPFPGREFPANAF